MNVKPGDRAVLIKDPDFPQNVGAFVRVVGEANPEYWGPSEDGNAEWVCKHDCELWGYAIEDWMPHCSAGETVFSDWQLQPIRDNDQKDQTLDWAPVPTKETA